MEQTFKGTEQPSSTNELVVEKMTEQPPEGAGKFNPNGPGGFGYNQCARCHTKVDVTGFDMDDRKHSEANGDCAGFAQAELDDVRVRLSTTADHRDGQNLIRSYLTAALAQMEQDVSSALIKKAVDRQLAVSKAKEFVEAVLQGKAGIATKNEFVRAVQTDVIAEAEKAVHAILYEAVELYWRIAQDLRFVATNEPKLIEAKRRIDDRSEQLGKLKTEYAEKLIQIEAPIHEADGREPGFYGTDPTCILDFPGWTEKPQFEFGF